MVSDVLTPTPAGGTPFSTSKSNGAANEHMGHIHTTLPGLPLLGYCRQCTVLVPHMCAACGHMVCPRFQKGRCWSELLGSGDTRLPRGWPHPIRCRGRAGSHVQRLRQGFSQRFGQITDSRACATLPISVDRLQRPLDREKVATGLWTGRSFDRNPPVKKALDCIRPHLLPPS
jgi:hypothetical protein